MKPVGICPSCERTVEFDSVAIASGLAYRCCNCWHHLTGSELQHARGVSERLAEHDAKRSAIINGGTHADAAKNGQRSR